MTTTTIRPATETLMRQIADLEEARDVLIAAINDITGSIDPDEATWPDVARYALLVDQVRRSGILGE